MHYTDRDIILALKQGKDEDVLSFLYKSVLPKVKHYIKTNKGSEDEAKDIFQDSVIIFYKKVRLSHLPDDVNITAYICQVSKNLWINRVKKINKTTELFDGDLMQTEEDFLGNLISEEKKNAILKLLSEIGEECKTLLKYSIYDSRSMKEICGLMGYSSENVAKTYNYRCKQKLIQLVMSNKAIENLLRN